MLALYHSIISEPLYNGLILLINIFPFFDAGVVVIIFTIIIKFILLPLSIKASKAQIEMKSIEKDLQLIKEKHKDSKEEQSRKTIEYYKEKGINPFVGLFILILQLAILAGVTTYFQISIATGPPSTGSGKQGDIAKAMQVQMKYFFPILVIFISYSISAALSLYWITSNVFAIIQEIYIKKRYHKAVTVV